MSKTIRQLCRCSVVCLGLLLTNQAIALELGWLSTTFFDIGLEAFQEYLTPDSQCAAGGDARRAQALNAMKGLGAILGAVGGAAIGGDTKSIVGGGLGGYQAGEVAGAAGKHYQSDLMDRNQHICEQLRAGATLLDPIATEMGATFGQLCGFSEEALQQDPARAMLEIQGCAARDSRVAKSLLEYQSSVRAINHQTCLSIRAYLKRWDSKQAQLAMQDGRSFLPTLDPHNPGHGYACN